MSLPPAFQFYADDFLAGTIQFTDSEVGLYIRLLCIQWSTGGLSDNDAELASYGKGGTSIDRVKTKFKKCSDGLLRNERMEEERAKQEAYRAACAEFGRSGGGNPAFKKGKPNPYYDKNKGVNKGGISHEDKGGISLEDKGRDKGRDKGWHKGEINSPSPSPSSVQREGASLCGSHSLSETREKNFPEAEIPSWKEFWDYSKSLGVPEWYAKDKFLAASQENWARARNWRAYAMRCFNWWTQDGRPKFPPVSRLASGKSQGTDIKPINGSLSHLVMPGNSGCPGV